MGEIKPDVGDHLRHTNTRSVLLVLVFLLDVTDSKLSSIPLEDLHID